jgi:hypothetical protein
VNISGKIRKPARRPGQGRAFLALIGAKHSATGGDAMSAGGFIALRRSGEEGKEETINNAN